MGNNVNYSENQLWMLFFQVTPREFIEKEGLDVGGSKIEIFHGNNFEMLGYKRDFKMSAQFSMATATFGDRLYVKEQGSSLFDLHIKNYSK